MKSKIVLRMAVSAISLMAIAVPASAKSHFIKKCDYALLSKHFTTPDQKREAFRNERAPSPDETDYEGSREDTGVDGSSYSGSTGDIDGTGGTNEAP